MPHPCGVATFTYDLATAAFPRQIVALHPPAGPDAYPAEVRHRIRRDVEEDYPLVAEALNASGVDVVSLQYAEAIWGGQDGSYVLDLVRALRLPVVTTLHEIPRHPTAGQARVITGLARASAATIVLSAPAAARLARIYGIAPDRIDIVPHGVPDLPLVDPDTVKPRLALEGRRVILSFGLLDPGKGCEATIEALPAVVSADPMALYVILGATRPDVLSRDGEAYRERLQALAQRLGVADHVRFVDKFVGRVELATWLEAADVVVTPYLDLDLASSGTLSYAMGAGKAIVSSPYVYAKDRLSRKRGVLVAPGSAGTLATALIQLLGDAKLRDAYGRRAYDDSRDMVWSKVGSEYSRIFSRVKGSQALASAPARRLAPAGH
jgi:glycosyltransferase involved in cell wall biosynthesis